VLVQEVGGQGHADVATEGELEVMVCAFMSVCWFGRPRWEAEVGRQGHTGVLAKEELETRVQAGVVQAGVVWAASWAGLVRAGVVRAREVRPVSCGLA